MLDLLKEKGYESFIVQVEGEKGNITSRELLRVVKQYLDSSLCEEQIIDWAVSQNKKYHDPWKGDGGALRIVVDLNRGTIKVYRYIYVVTIESHYDSCDTINIQ
jgi:hypothetical protein